MIWFLCCPTRAAFLSGTPCNRISQTSYCSLNLFSQQPRPFETIISSVNVDNDEKYNSYQLSFAEPLSVLPRLWYLLHDLDENKKTVADFASNFSFFTKPNLLNNIYIHYLTRMVACELVSLYWKTGTCGRFHSTLRENFPPLSELLESPHGLGLFVTYVILKLIFQRIFHFNAENDIMSKKLLQGPQQNRQGESFTIKFKEDPTLRFLFLEARAKTSKKGKPQIVDSLSGMFFLLKMEMKTQLLTRSKTMAKNNSCLAN
jgi:hypothetical protein